MELLEDVEVVNVDKYKYLLHTNDSIQIHFDWFSFTFPLFKIDGALEIEYLYMVINKICFMLGFDFENEKTVYDWAVNRYQKTIQIGTNIFFRAFGSSTRVNIDGHEFESCQFEITGQGCREIESRLKVDYIKLFNYVIKDLKGRCKRVDIAIDDNKGDIIKLSTIKYYIDNNYFISSYFRTKECPPLPIGRLDTGFSYTFGRHGSTQLCIYDKKSEQASRNKMDLFQDYKVRYEMRFVDKKSDKLVSELLPYYLSDVESDNFGKFCMQQLKAMLDLKDKKSWLKYNDVNKHKSDTLKSWDEFLGNVSKSKFSLDPKEFLSIDKKQEWFEKNMIGLFCSFGLSGCYNLDDKNIKQYSNPFVGLVIGLLNACLDKFIDDKFRQRYFPLIRQFLIQHNLLKNDEPKSFEEEYNLIVELIKDLDDKYKLDFDEKIQDLFDDVKVVQND